MAVRYEGDDRFPDLELNDKVNNGSSPLHGKMSVLQMAQAGPSRSNRTEPQ